MKPRQRTISRSTFAGLRNPQHVLVAFAFATLLYILAVSPIRVGAAAPPIAQCNNDTASNVGGQGIACTVTVDNYLTVSGSIEVTAPSTVTVKRCTGAAGPIGAGSGTCTTTTSTSAEPITLVQQCNGSGNGGGGVVICTVIFNNHFSNSPGVSTAAAKVYQCIGSEITGPGAPGSCNPANTPGVSSVSDATVGQCNGSGNGGTSVGFTCTVTGGSTMTSALTVNVDQCNGSGNGGGSLVTCAATVSNLVTASTVTPSATATSATPTGTAGSGTTTPTPSGGSTTPTASTTTATASASTTTPTAPVSTVTPTSPGATAVATAAAPRPPATGNSGSGPGVASLNAWLLLVGIIGAATVVVVTWTSVSRRR